jgi:hypothetical protein
MSKLMPDRKGLGVLGTADPLADGQQRGELVSRGSRVPGTPRPVGQLLACGKSVRVIRARYPLADGQQRGELVSRAGRVPGVSGPIGQVEPGG